MPVWEYVKGDGLKIVGKAPTARKVSAQQVESVRLRNRSSTDRCLMRLLSCVLSVLLGCVLFSLQENGAPLRAAEKKSENSAAKPVPVNMHDFMEGVFQSPYRRLKAAMATEP